MALTDSQPVIYSTLGVLAVVFVVAMWALARRLRPERSATSRSSPTRSRWGAVRGEDGEPAVERRIGEEVAFESWLPAWRTEERRTVRFRIPPDAPYSHEGECLSFAWRVSAREPDRVAEEGASNDPIWVLP